MQYRALGKTGIKVSPYCLGAMMFGGPGNPDHDDCIRMIHKALDFGINLIAVEACSPAPTLPSATKFWTGSTRSLLQEPMPARWARSMRRRP